MPEVLNVSLYGKSIPSVVEEIISLIKSGSSENRLISATGAHGIITSKKDKSFKEILNSFYLNLPDGMPGVWVGRMKGAKEMERCYGPDVFKYVMQETAALPFNHYFCGGNQVLQKN